jgi:hypothetical protein
MSNATRDREIYHVLPLHRQFILMWKWYQKSTAQRAATTLTQP